MKSTKIIFWSANIKDGMKGAVFYSFFQPYFDWHWSSFILPSYISSFSFSENKNLVSLCEYHFVFWNVKLHWAPLASFNSLHSLVSICLTLLSWKPCGFITGATHINCPVETLSLNSIWISVFFLLLFVLFVFNWKSRNHRGLDLLFALKLSVQPWSTNYLHLSTQKHT